MASTEVLQAHLELSDSGTGVLVAVRADGVEQRYAVGFRACLSPVCRCRNVDLVCVSCGEPDERPAQRVISLDVVERWVGVQRETTPPEDLPLAKAVADGLTDEQWRHLWGWLRAEKQRAMARMDLDALDVEFPAAVIEEGVLVGYGEIFPFGEPLTFPHDGKEWMAEDLHCVQPRCRCREATLCFYPLPPGALTGARPAGTRPLPVVAPTAAVRYDLLRRHWSLEDEPPASTATARALVGALETSHPELLAALAERRRQLRHLSARWLARQLPPPAGAAQKVGRNDPCPCGSGKKFKRCCGK